MRSDAIGNILHVAFRGLWQSAGHEEPKASSLGHVVSTRSIKLKEV